MNAISLWQPWASAIACGAKRYETRSWSTPYRGPILIHAALRPVDLYGEQAWRDAGLRFPAEGFPLGGIVAIARLHQVWPIAPLPGITLSRLQAPPTEEALGDWSEGRFAWELRDIRRLSAPVPCRGRQGLFSVPGDVAAAVSARTPA